MRIALLADVHANLAALRTVLQHLDQETRPDTVWFLGDLVGYNPSPVFCARLLASRVVPGGQVAGNHDRGLTGQLAPAYFSPDAWWVLEERHIPQSHELIPSLAELPSYRRAPWDNGETMNDVWLLHGRATAREVDNLTGRPSYIFELPDDVAYTEGSWQFLREEGKGVAPRLLLAGHSHWPQLWRRDIERFPDNQWGELDEDTAQRKAEKPIDLGEEPVWLNPGSVGQPRDGDPRTGYVLLDLAQNQATFHRLAYDIADTQEKMRLQGYPVKLIERLEQGR